MTSNMNTQVDLASGDSSRSTPETFQTTLCSVLFVVAGAMFVGNAMMMVKTVRSKLLQGQVSVAFIVNLGIADLAIGLIWAEMAPVALGFNVDQVNEIWCRAVSAAIYCCITASTLTLACISIERYITVLPSLTRGSLLNTGRVRVAIACTWLQGLMVGCAPLVLERIIDNNHTSEEVSKAQWPLKYKVFFTIATFVLCLLLPTATILIYYNSVVSGIEKETESPGRVGPKAAFPALLPTQLHDKTTIDYTLRTVDSMMVIVFIFLSFMTPLSLIPCSCAFTWALLPYASTFWLHIMVLSQKLLIPSGIISFVKTSTKNARKCLNI